MKIGSLLLIIIAFLWSCNLQNEDAASVSTSIPLTGTWKLITGTLIENGDTVITDYTEETSFIKIINDTHFAFLQHDLTNRMDSLAVFVAGGGSYSLIDSTYTEHLEYCSARNWEGNDFTFTIGVRNDTLTQKGVEKIESEGIDRLNIEKYVRVKP